MSLGNISIPGVWNENGLLDHRKKKMSTGGGGWQDFFWTPPSHTYFFSYLPSPFYNYALDPPSLYIYGSQS